MISDHDFFMSSLSAAELSAMESKQAATVTKGGVTVRRNLSDIAVAFFILVAAISPISAKRDAAGQREGNSTAQKSTDPGNVSTNNQPTKPVEATNKADDNHNGDSDKLSRKDKITIAISVLLFLVVLGQLVISAFQARIYNQQRKIMQQQIEAIETTERAYIGIANMRMIVSGDEPRLEITWVNGGKTPAWHFRCVPSLNVGEKPESKGYLMDDDFSDIRGSFIPAGAERPVTYDHLGIKISDQLLSQLRGGTERLYAVMSGCYRDVKWKNRQFEYWALYDPDPFSPKWVELESEYEKARGNPN